jgi:hypothetical protein
MNKADRTMKYCHLCALIHKVRADEYEVGFGAGYAEAIKERDFGGKND